MRITSLLALATSVAGYVVDQGSKCTLYPESLFYKAAVDDSPSILEAFKLCGVNGTIIFTNHTFTIASVLNTTNLLNVEDQVTAWLFGGQNVTYRGQGGWIDGNGQTWYDYSNNRANLPGRPITLTVFNSTDVLLDHLVIHQPQFWATLVWQSKNVSYTNYYTNATSNSTGGTGNTDGYDSWNSADLRIVNATIVTEDDCVAAKGNTTNLVVKNITCHGGAGITIGSIGQYPATPDYVENILFEDVQCVETYECAYVKTWQGEVLDATTNGDAGGGGSGLVKNVTFRNFQLHNVNLPIQISQCIYAGSGGHGCNTSKIAIEDVHWVNFTGTTQFNVVASLYCSDLHPCPNVTFSSINLESVNSTLGLPMWNTSIQNEIYQCTNIVHQNTSGIPCNAAAPDYFSQYLDHNLQ